MLKNLLCIFSVFFLSAAVSAAELKDLSADATYDFQIQTAYSSDLNIDKNASVYKDFLLKDNPDPKQKFAFQTKLGGRGGGEDSPYIIIRLAKESIIKKIYIQNRLDDNKKWASNLTVWTSKDQNMWNRVWSSKTAENEWTIDLPNGEPAKFVMVGLDKERGILSLNKVRIYGE